MSEKHAADPDNCREGVNDQRDRRNDRRLVHRSTAIGGTLAGEAAEHVEHPAAPGGDRVVVSEQREIADGARPLESTEDEVIGIGWRVAAEKLLALERAAQRRQALPEGGQPRVAVLDHIFETAAEPF